MTRAEIHGPLAELETLIDEYYLAAGVDPRRRDYLDDEIVATAERHGLDRDLGLDRDDGGEALRALDAHLCELKEMQIRDGLHILGASPEGRQRIDTLVAIARVPRCGGRPGDASLHRAIAADLGLGDFDPLDCDLAAAWAGPRPAALAALSDAPWRTDGDTVERIETAALVAALVDRSDDGRGDDARTACRRRPRAVLDWIAADLAPALDRSGEAEIAAVLAALDGRFVPPGPSGAPTRGRPDVLPTGRNFYSVDVRAVPTAAAWALGRRGGRRAGAPLFPGRGRVAALDRAVGLGHVEHAHRRRRHRPGAGADRRRAACGKPGTGRVTGFRVMPLSELGRPRIDVTLKISGMFRDAFPEQIDLIDSAVRAVAALDEDDDANPIAAAARRGSADGADSIGSRTLAGARIFGAKPGAYGAGLQALIDEGIWRDARRPRRRLPRLGRLRLWRRAADGASGAGPASPTRLEAVDAVLHNQDNREHDILDSDDYYQFQGGLAAAVETLKGAAPRVYHGDHSRPEKPVVRSLARGDRAASCAAAPPTRNGSPA